MIKHLQNKEIDKDKWDQCITNATNPTPHAFSWYLDCVSPKWEALVVGDYELIMPLLIARKWGISYLRQALFCQQTGLYSKDISLINEYKNTFFEYIQKRYRLIDLCLHKEYDVASIALPNYTLPLSETYEVLSSQYATNTKRNLKKAHAENLTTATTNLETLIDLFKNDKSKPGTFSEDELNRLRSIYSHPKAQNHIKVLGVYNSDQMCIAGAMFVVNVNRIIFLFSGNSVEGKEKRALFLLMDIIIKEFSNQELILDFDGSSNENIARFYMGFGSKLERYYHLKVNRLPALIRLLKG